MTAEVSLREISLREVSADSVRAICALSVAEHQRGYVAPNAVSIAQAYFAPAARFRAIFASETPVGFVMWRPVPDAADACFLWRFMVDGGHQGRGYGKAALALLFETLRDEAIATITTSVVRGPASPLEFYRSLGFRETGEALPNGEIVLALAL